MYLSYTLHWTFIKLLQMVLGIIQNSIAHLVYNLSYFSHRIINSFPQIEKLKIIKLVPVLLAPMRRRPRKIKFVLILMIVTSLYPQNMIFKYGSEQDQIQRILIGFEAKLEIKIFLPLQQSLPYFLRTWGWLQRSWTHWISSWP